MSAQPNGTAAKPQATSEVIGLMRRMGATSFNPLPPDQHRWQRGKDEPPLDRMWSYMVEHTCGIGHRSEYAVNNEGQELHMEHLIKALEMDEGNAYRTWRKGLRKGLWRSGTLKEGKRRLYLCGKVVPKAQTEGEQTEKETVCADSWPPYILKQIKALKEEEQVRFWEEARLFEAIHDTLRAELDAARRLLIAERQHTLLDRYGVKERPQKPHEPKHGDGILHQDRQDRVKALVPVLTPIMERYAQTVMEFAQTTEPAVRTPENGAAQTSVSLLRSDTTREPQKSPAGGPLSRSAAAPANAGHGWKKSDGLLPALKQLPALKAEDEDAETLLWNMLRNVQTSFPHTDFGSEALARDRRCDVVAIRNMLAVVGSGNVHQFVLWITGKMKGLDRNGLAKLPSRYPGDPTGPRSLGLFSFWAAEYAQKLDEAARERVTPQRRREEIAACLNILRDPNEDAAAKQYARNLLHTHGVEHGMAEGATT